MQKNYSIHNIVKFRIVNEAGLLSNLLSSIDVEYRNFEVDEVDEPDFVIRLGKFTPSNHDCYILDDKYYVRENYLYCRDSYKLGKWQLEMTGFESGKMTVRISPDPIAAMVILPIIDFVIRLHMAEKGYPFVHGSCVSQDGRAFLFPAVSGGGKTVIALSLVERGFKFLGDNFAILHQGQVLSFLSPLNIFTYNLAPGLKKRLRKKDRTALNIKALIYKATLGYAKLFTKVNVGDVFSDSLTDRSKLAAVFLLIPKEKLTAERISKAELIDHLVVNYRAEASMFLEYILAYSYMFPESRLAGHWRLHRRNLEEHLSQSVPIHKVEVPQRYNEGVIDDIVRLVR